MCNDYVSVIIPVYNGEEYLRRCIESVLHQSYQYLEIIVVDDGSTDSTKEIYTEYLNRDKRIKAYTIKHSGVSFARNQGIENAIGKWLMFVDADDWIESDAIEVLINEVDKRNDLTWVTGDNDRRGKNENDNTCIRVYEKKDYESELISSCIVYPDNLSSKYYKGIEGLKLRGPVMKLYSLSLIKKNNIRFDTNLKLGEDQLFNLHYLQYVECLVFINSRIYHYTKNKFSSSNNVNGMLEKRISRINAIEAYLNKLGIKEQKKEDVDILIGEDAYAVTKIVSSTCDMSIREAVNVLKSFYDNPIIKDRIRVGFYKNIYTKIILWSNNLKLYYFSVALMRIYTSVKDFI